MYYPPSQILTNQNTPGGEFTLNGQNYQGPYWTSSDGKVWTGKSPQDQPVERLSTNTDNVKANPKGSSEPLSQLINSTYNIDPAYYQARNLPYNPAVLDAKAPQPPLPELVFPTEKQYSLGEFQRYFAKKTNERKYIEISKKTYQGLVNKNPGLQWQLYEALPITWILEGKMKDTYITNRRIVEIVSIRSQWFGFTSYFKGDYLRYFRFSTNENLFTDGNEFISRSTGRKYKGFYHIHPTKGPMEGKQHKKQFHDFLDPIFENVEIGTSRRTNISRGGY